MIIVRPCSYDADECDGETTAYNNSICNCEEGLELVNGLNNMCEGIYVDYLFVCPNITPHLSLWFSHKSTLRTQAMCRLANRIFVLQSQNT